MFKDELLRDLVEYNPESGYMNFKYFDDDLLVKLGFNSKTYSKSARGKRRYGVMTATGNHGYIFFNLSYLENDKYQKKVFTVHRVAWFITYGYWPKVIDHINGIKTDNRLINLRDVSMKENYYNSLIRGNNTSGKTGVAWSKCKGKWRAYATVEGKQIFLGYFEDINDAINKRLLWEDQNSVLCRG